MSRGIHLFVKHYFDFSTGFLNLLRTHMKMVYSGYVSDIKNLDVAELKPALNTTLVTNQAGLEKVAQFFERVKTFGFDTETNIVPRFTTRKLRTIQVGNRDEQYVIDLLAFAGSPEDLASGQGKKQTSSWAKPVVDALRAGLDSKAHVKVGANLQFDYETVLWCLGLRSWNFYDVQLAEKVIYAGQENFFREGFWALDDLVERYCHLKISKDEQKSFDLETPLTDRQIEYAALDTRLPLAVMAGQRAVIEKAKLGRIVQVENDAIPAFGEMHINGVLMDASAWTALGKDNEAAHKANIKVLDTFFLPVVGKKEAPTVDVAGLEEAWRAETDREKRAELRRKYQAGSRAVREWTANAAKYEGEAAINYNATAQLLAALRKLGFGAKILPSTNDKILAKHSDRPVIQAIQNYRETAQIIKNFGEAWLEHIDPVTGRIHSTINQMGAATGRTSSSKPNIQNIKKEKKWRRCFVARAGRRIVTTDMSGAELRIMADDSRDETWIVAFEKDWDLHSIGAEMAEPAKWAACALEGCNFAAKKLKCECPAHKKLRDDTKSLNFGIAYGMEESAVAAKLHISKEAAGSKLTNWRRVNKGVNDYLARSGETAKLQCCAHDMLGRRRLFDKPDWKRAAEIAVERVTEDAVKKEAELARLEKRKPRPAELLPRRPVDSKAIGRVYYAMFGSIEREGKNMRVQGTNATIAKIAMGAGFDKDGKPFMWHLLPEYDALLENFVHDEFVNDAPEERAEEVRLMVEDCILRAGAEVLRRVKMLSESHIGECWTK